MGAVATFDYDAWKARYPELAAQVDATLAGSYFAEATLYHRNDGTGPVSDAGQQLVLLNMIVAHIAARYLPQPAGSPPGGLVGRISSASEGSVSVSTDMPSEPGTAAWFQQTRYGADYWAATAPFRTMRYVPSPKRFAGRIW